MGGGKLKKSVRLGETTKLMKKKMKRKWRDKMNLLSEWQVPFHLKELIVMHHAVVASGVDVTSLVSRMVGFDERKVQHSPLSHASSFSSRHLLAPFDHSWICFQ